MISTWPCPAPDGRTTAEYAFGFDRGRPLRVLVVPALFDEANRMRHMTTATIRLLDDAGVDSLLPDLPGTNESLEPLAFQTLETWRAAADAAASHFRATHVLAIRGGALIAPALPGWHLAPINGASILRQLLRARVISAREAGREESRDILKEQGLARGLDLAGYALSGAMIAALDAAVPTHGAITISQADIGGSGLWLRAEPDHDPAQAQALAALVATGLQR